MIELYPFNGYTVVVFGLKDEGLVSALAFQESGVTIWAWDDDPTVRELAVNAGVTLTDLSKIDWSEPVSMVIEHDIPHGQNNVHEYVKAAREVRCEVIGDVELLARVQREAAFIGVTGHKHRDKVADVIGYVLEVNGREVESTGLDKTSPLKLNPMALEGAYVLDMPPGKLDTSFSITFDVAIWLNFSDQEIINGNSAADELTSMRWIFHRQTAPKTALINIDDPIGAELFEELSKDENKKTLPISIQQVPDGGVGVNSNGWLVDGREGAPVEVIDLNETDGFSSEDSKIAAVAAYACGVSIGLQSHAVMACLNSYEIDDE